ncbi:MAG: lamin tail domain-containing protein [Pirellulales bacterium]|nr:lamin tail domain-containing protein [Pirellulales bacterium]
MKRVLATLSVLLFFASAAQAGMVITEWMYSGNSGEYIEFTNTGTSDVDMTGWSFDDDSQTAGTVDLSAYGIVTPGKSVLLIEPTDTDAFRTAWSLPSTVKIIGGNGANLGRNDMINLYDSSSTLVDFLSYGDQTYPGSIRTQNTSGIPIPMSNIGTHDVYDWNFAVSGDVYGSHTSSGGDVGNPGIFVPEPATIWTLFCGLIAAGVFARLRRR